MMLAPRTSTALAVRNRSSWRHAQRAEELHQKHHDLYGDGPLFRPIWFCSEIASESGEH